MPIPIGACRSPKRFRLPVKSSWPRRIAGKSRCRDWARYGDGGEYPYVHRHWYDPFDRNKWKGDQPIIGQQTFLNITATSVTSADGRCLPTPTNVSPARPGSSQFFGDCNQFGLSQTFRFSFDLFHGDASFRPVDWRIRITPAINVNYLKVQELGVVNVDPRAGTSRLDSHVGLQEAFVEVKLHDLSPNYDFISVRAGIQDFSSDFRGFIFTDEQPGVRIFGNLKSDRWEYNAAYFQLLEKNTNSDLNTFGLRHQQVLVGNFYMQDFIRPGYTTEFSIHYNKDDASLHYDDNGFLVRPAEIGSERMHSVRAVYLGWAGSGHFGWLNVNHAFYQALGRDDFNPIAGRSVTINAQMAALELSVDRDWMRFRVSSFYASGDAESPRRPRPRLRRDRGRPQFRRRNVQPVAARGNSPHRFGRVTHFAGQLAAEHEIEQIRGAGEFRESGNFHRQRRRGFQSDAEAQRRGEFQFPAV